MPKLEDDKPLPKTSLAVKIGSSLAAEARECPAAWYRAQTRGWTRKQYLHWVETGLEPGQKPMPVKESSSNDESEDERVRR